MFSTIQRANDHFNAPQCAHSGVNVTSAKTTVRFTHTMLFELAFSLDPTYLTSWTVPMFIITQVSFISCISNIHCGWKENTQKYDPRMRLSWSMNITRKSAFACLWSQHGQHLINTSSFRERSRRTQWDKHWTKSLFREQNILIVHSVGNDSWVCRDHKTKKKNLDKKV